MRRFTLPALLCCCAFASASAAEVQVFAATYAAKKREMPAESQPAISSFASRTAGTRTSPAAGNYAAPRSFAYTDPTAGRTTAEILRGYQPKQIVHPFAKIDPSVDPRLPRAATIAQERARAYTRRRCWRYVKEALLASGAIDSYPKSVNAKEAGDELVRDYGFKRLAIKDPYAAPIGSVLVYYKGRHRPGHVEFRTKDGFVSDFRSKTAQPHPLLGVYAKRG